MSAAERFLLPVLSSSISWNLLRAEGMLWLWQMLVMALPTSWRLAWALEQVSQEPRGDPGVCVGTLQVLGAGLGPTLAWELPELPSTWTLGHGHTEVDWAASGAVSDSKTSGKEHFRCSFSGFPAWGAGGGVDCCVGVSCLQSFS